MSRGNASNFCMSSNSIYVFIIALACQEYLFSFAMVGTREQWNEIEYIAVQQVDVSA
jgi:hypothetical protein